MVYIETELQITSWSPWAWWRKTPQNGSKPWESSIWFLPIPQPSCKLTKMPRTPTRKKGGEYAPETPKPYKKSPTKKKQTPSPVKNSDPSTWRRSRIPSGDKVCRGFLRLTFDIHHFFFASRRLQKQMPGNFIG